MPPRNHKLHPAETAPVTQEIYFTGAELNLPMVGFVVASHEFNAVPVHWHSHERYEVMLMLRGGAAYEFQNGTSLELGGGQFMITPPGLSHRAKRDVRTPSVICAITFDIARAVTGHSPFTAAEKDWIETRLRDCAPHPQAMTPELQRMAHWLHQWILQNRPPPTPAGTIASMRLLVLLVILEAVRHAEGNRVPRHVNVVARASSYMQAHFAEPVGMRELADKAGCSRAHLFAVFKRESGMSPNDWLQRLRVRKAEEWLATTGEPLTDIALNAGFSSHQYFCHVFRKYTGKTPGEYRRNCALPIL